MKTLIFDILYQKRRSIKENFYIADVRILLSQCRGLAVSGFTVIIICRAICRKCRRLVVSRFTVSDQFLTKA